MKRRLLIRGEVVNENGIKYVCDDNDIINSSGRAIRMCVFECSCGAHFRSRLSDVVTNRRSSCGCKKGNKAYKYESGSFIKGVEFVKPTSVKNYISYGIFKCPLCGNLWEASINNIKTGNVKSCCNYQKDINYFKWDTLSKFAALYYVRLYNENESFYKIGVTMRSVHTRMAKIPYNYELIITYHGDPKELLQFENRFKRLYRKHKYVPLLKFGGYTECFN